MQRRREGERVGAPRQDVERDRQRAPPTSTVSASSNGERPRRRWRRSRGARAWRAPRRPGRASAPGSPRDVRAKPCFGRGRGRTAGRSPDARGSELPRAVDARASMKQLLVARRRAPSSPRAAPSTSARAPSSAVEPAAPAARAARPAVPPPLPNEPAGRGRAAGRRVGAPHAVRQGVERHRRARLRRGAGSRVQRRRGPAITRRASASPRGGSASSSQSTCPVCARRALGASPS
jgi:hypothetical protein